MAFLATFSLGAMVRDSLKTELGDSDMYTDAMGSWTEVIRTHGIDGSSNWKSRRLYNERKKVFQFKKVSAAMYILALLTSAGVVVTSPARASSRRVSLWGLYYCTFVNGMILLAVMMLEICTMKYGPRSPMWYVTLMNSSTLEFKDVDKYLGPGMYTGGRRSGQVSSCFVCLP